MSPTPNLRAFVICERVLTDASTGMPSMINLFNRVIAVAGFPHVHLCAAFISMVGGHGKVPVSIRMTDLSTGQVFGEFGGITDFKDPVEPAQMAVCMALRFPQAGLYALELNINKTLVATHKLIVEAPPVISYTG